MADFSEGNIFCKMKSRPFLILLLALISFAIYANSLGGDFLIDDQSAILNNQVIHDYKAYFLKHFSIKSGLLDELKLVFLWHISGENPFFYHLFNVFVHSVCVILIFILIDILFGNRVLSFLSSLIFAIHPIHTEVVSWISGGPYASSSLFFLAAFIFYLKSNQSLFYLLLTVVFFSLCLFSGNSVFMLPLIFILYELFFRKSEGDKSRKIRLLAILSILAVAVILALMSLPFRNNFTRTIFYFRGPSYLIVIVKAFLYYLKILYLPLRRGLYHPFGYNTTDIQKISPDFFVSLAVISSLIYLFFRYRKKDPVISFGIGWFFVTYLPYSNIIPICNIISERYMYLPSVGFSIILAYLIVRLWHAVNKYTLNKAAWRRLTIVVITLFLSAYALLTLKRNYEYSNIITYWESNINNFPDGYMAYNNLAGTYYQMGQKEQAIAYCWVNLMVNPNQPHVWCNLGKVYREKGNFKQAMDCYQEALRIDSGYASAQKALDEIKVELKKGKGVVK